VGRSGWGVGAPVTVPLRGARPPVSLCCASLKITTRWSGHFTSCEIPLNSGAVMPLANLQTTMLQQFQSDLEKLIGKPTDLRPFVCEGSPLECKIFIVGFNPATELERSFWSFWQPEYGFQKTEWLKVYKQERRDKPLSPGKTRRNEISNTRRVIEWIIAEAMLVKCLETNIYSKPTEKARDLREQEWATQPFDFLLRTIRPQVCFPLDKLFREVQI